MCVCASTRFSSVCRIVVAAQRFETADRDPRGHGPPGSSAAAEGEATRRVVVVRRVRVVTGRRARSPPTVQSLSAFAEERQPATFEIVRRERVCRSQRRAAPWRRRGAARNWPRRWPRCADGFARTNRASRSLKDRGRLLHRPENGRTVTRACTLFCSCQFARPEPSPL